MHTVLDLDLDVFSHPGVYAPPNNKRPSNRSYFCAAQADVTHFLEEQCHLDRCAPIPGCEFIHHDKAFYEWRRWLKEGVLQAPFAIVHVDAHADMGNGDAGYFYLMTELLSMPVDSRSDPYAGFNGLNAGNYLMFAVANRWVSKLEFVYPTRHPWVANWYSSDSQKFEPDPASDGAPSDLLMYHFKDENWRSGLLQLKHCSEATLKCCLGTGELAPILAMEPDVPFLPTPLPNYSFNGFTHMVVAHSPRYCPPATDKLLPLIRQYFRPM